MSPNRTGARRCTACGQVASATLWALNQGHCPYCWTPRSMITLTATISAIHNGD